MAMDRVMHVFNELSIEFAKLFVAGGMEDSTLTEEFLSKWQPRTEKEALLWNELTAPDNVEDLKAMVEECQNPRMCLRNRIIWTRALHAAMDRRV